MSIKTYKKGIQLTKNINSSELVCPCCKVLKLNIIIVNQVQDFMNINGYTKCIISSCYRCSKRNAQIKGSKGSQHCISDAIDLCFYIGKTIVSSKIVCCKAQDYGFNGIAYIDKNYVHLDSRTSGKYRGDERYGYGNNVPNGDFYKYFNIKRENETPQPPVDKFNLTRTLKKGCKGNDVKELQKKLGIKADGIFGNDTLNAVKKFQKANKLSADGIVGKNTAHKLGWLYNGK